MMRHIRHLWKIGAAAALLCVVSAGYSASYGPDAVEDLRQALKIPIRDSTNKDELKYRKDTLLARSKALSIGDLRRALVLQEWRDDDRDENIAAGDREVRDDIAKRLVETLQKILASPSVPARLAAITEIAEMGVAIRATGSRNGLARELAPDLAKQLKEGEPIVREAAARAIGKINPDPKVAAPALGALLSGKDSTARERSAAADGLAWLMRTMDELNKGNKRTGGIEVSRKDIVDMGAAVVPEAKLGLPDREFTVRRNVLEALQLSAKLLGDQVADPPASSQFPPAGRKKWTEDEKKEVEKYRKDLQEERDLLAPLVQALDSASAPLAKTLTADPVAEIRFMSAKALEDMGYARQKILRRAGVVPAESDTGKEEARRKAGVSGILLVAANEVVAQKEPEKKADAGNDALRAGLVDALRPLASRFADPNVRVRLSAADALEPLGPLAAPVVPMMVPGLTDRDLFVRWATARALGRIGAVDTEVTVPLLANLLCDPDLDVRLAAATTLGSYGAKAKSAVPALADAATSGDAEQRAAAIRALQGIGSDAESAIPALISALGNREDARVRKLAAETLGHFGRAAKSAIPALEKALFDPEDAVRKAASDSLLAITQAN